MMKAEIMMVFLALLLIPAHIMAEEAETPEDSLQTLVATNCCLDYQEVCLEVACHEACTDWGNRCRTDCGQRCQWNCLEWGYGCYECCELLNESECEMGEDGSLNCLNGSSAANCTECCDDYECVGGWNQTCTDSCMTECDKICLVKGQVCECTKKAWRCDRWGPCYVPEGRIAGGLNASGEEDAAEAVYAEGNQSAEVSNETVILEPPDLLDENGGYPADAASE